MSLDRAEAKKSSVRIERFVPSDLDAIMEIENSVFTLPWSRESYEELAPLDTISIRVAKMGERVVGYMLFQNACEEVELHTIAVANEMQRRGIANDLMKYMLSEAARQGVRRVFLHVRPSNDVARALYAKFGFVAIAKRSKYYRDDGEDALVMRLDVGP